MKENKGRVGKGRRSRQMKKNKGRVGKGRRRRGE
jgi:hypothetical protein